nr:TSUP family transporter [uncultured Oscillibacter sp.]
MGGNWPARIAGGAAGLANGLFGGGGGMVFLPILSRWGGLPQRKLYATCVGVIFPVCLVSAAVYLWRGGVSLMAALPYLAGGLIGGFLGGRLYGGISTKFLKWLFAAFLFYAGVKYLL